MWCAIMQWCLLDIIWGVLPCHSLRLLHRICPLKICCQHHLIYLSSCTNNQPPCGPFFTVVSLYDETRFSVILVFSPLSSFPQKSDALWPYLPHLLHVSLKNLLLCFSFLQILVIEHSLQDCVSLVSCFRLIMSSRSNEFISCDTCMPSLRGWHYKRLSQVYKLLLGNQKLVPSYNFHLSHILP